MRFPDAIPIGQFFALGEESIYEGLGRTLADRLEVMTIDIHYERGIVVRSIVFP